MEKKLFRSEETIRRHLSDQQKSGLNISEYCRRHKLPISSFGNWRLRFVKGKKTSPITTPPDFVKILPVSLKTPSAIEVHTGPLKMIINEGCDTAIIRAALSVIKELYLSGLGGAA